MSGSERYFDAQTYPAPEENDSKLLDPNAADMEHENLINRTPSGIPEHRLRIKIGAVMMLTTNLSVERGLCNGTRVQILAYDHYIIRVRILTGKSKGEEEQLFRIKFQFGGDPEAPHEGTIKAFRVQFPLRPGMAITINKSQGN
jgi:ATP-dependent DNA helicase PIF1